MTRVVTGSQYIGLLEEAKVQISRDGTGCVISMILGVVLVIALQRYLVDGISITGMAGR